MVRRYVPAVGVVVGLLLAGCGGVTGVDVGSGEVGGGAAGSCLRGATECDDTVTSPSGPADGDASIDPADGDASFDVEAARADAKALLGVPEGELPGEVRVSRRGDEHFFLTEDYVLGRMTVELDGGADGGAYVVTSVTVELPEGPQTFTS